MVSKTAVVGFAVTIIAVLVALGIASVVKQSGIGAKIAAKLTANKTASEV